MLAKPADGEKSFDITYSTVFYGGAPAVINTSGNLELLTCDMVAAVGGARRIQGYFQDCSEEVVAHGNGRATYLPAGATLALGSGYSKNNYTDDYPYKTTDTYVPGDKIYLGYDGLWTNVAAGSTAGIDAEYGVLEEDSDNGLVIRFYDQPII